MKQTTTVPVIDTVFREVYDSPASLLGRISDIARSARSLQVTTRFIKPALERNAARGFTTAEVIGFFRAQVGLPSDARHTDVDEATATQLNKLLSESGALRTGGVAGMVVSPQGQPVKDVKLQLYRTTIGGDAAKDGEVVATDAQGRFLLATNPTQAGWLEVRSVGTDGAEIPVSNGFSARRTSAHYGRRQTGIRRCLSMRTPDVRT